MVFDSGVGLIGEMAGLKVLEGLWIMMWIIIWVMIVLLVG